MSERKPFVVSANIYEYKKDDNSKDRAALMTVSHTEGNQKIAITLINGKVCKVEFDDSNRSNSRIIGNALELLKEQDFYEQIYKNSNSADIHTVKGTEKMMDLIRIGTPDHTTVLEVMKIIRSGKVPELEPQQTAIYEEWGTW